MSSIASLSGNSSITNGELAPQSLQVINCTYASQQIERDMKGGSMGPAADPLYRPSSDPNDHMIAFGDVLFQLKNMSGGFGNPIVRSSLQGIVPQGVPPPPGSDTDLRIGTLMDDIIIVGFSGKTCIPNQRALSHTENPIALVCGHITIVNVSQDEWRAGDTLIACLPAKGRINTQAPNDGSLNVTALRRVVEPVPLRTLMAPIRAGKATTEQFHRVVSRNKLQSFIKSRAVNELIESIAFHLSVFIQAGAGVTDDQRREMLKEFTGSMESERSGAYTQTTVLTAAMLAVAKTDSKKAAAYMTKWMDLDSNKPTQASVDVMASVLRLSSLTTSLLSHRTLGRVTRGCRPGAKGDVSIGLGAFNINETNFM